jgi:hypothetical protein
MANPNGLKRDFKVAHVPDTPLVPNPATATGSETPYFARGNQKNLKNAKYKNTLSANRHENPRAHTHTPRHTTRRCVSHCVCVCVCVW